MVCPASRWVAESAGPASIFSKDCHAVRAIAELASGGKTVGESRRQPRQNDVGHRRLSCEARGQAVDRISRTLSTRISGSRLKERGSKERIPEAQRPLNQQST